MKKVCVVTGTRAEYGLLKPLIDKISKADDMKLILMVTGMHLSPEFGLTYQEIENDGYHIDEKVEIILSSDTSVGIAKSMALALSGFSEAFERHQPDLLVVLGDRYEIMAVASAASVARIPIAHLHGGETTEGAFDEAFRHSITKMSRLHFTSTEEYRNRVIQLGENPDFVFNTGAIGVENIKTIELMTREELINSIGFDLSENFVLVTYHPVTLESGTAREQFESLLKALDSFPEVKIIFTKANSDTDGRIINSLIDSYESANPKRVKSFTSMGLLRYLSAMSITSAVIGNSSSGIIEAPSFGVPTVNIGERQKGRIQADSIINCNANQKEIEYTIKMALSPEFSQKAKLTSNPYGSSNVSDKIMQEIRNYLSKADSLKKSFYDL